MHPRTGSILLAVLVLVGALAPAAHAGEQVRRAPQRARALPAAATISGHLSGSITGEVRVDGTVYRLAPDARIYESGVGFVRPGVSYFDRVVTLSIVAVRGVPVVRSVQVSPAVWPSDLNPVGVMDDTGPR